MSNKQLSSVSAFDVEKIVFSEAKETSIPGSYRITIGTQYPNGTVGPLLFSTDNVYSFGLQENKSLDKDVRTTGYSIPLCLWNQDGPTEIQTQFIDTLERVSDYIKKYMLRPEVKKAVKKYDLVESDLRKFSPLWYKKEDGEVVQGRGPMLYPKLMCDKNLQIFTVIADKSGADMDPMQLLGQKCIVRACIKIESIFIGSKISLQVKVLELEVQQQGNQRQRLICRQPPAESVVYEEPDALNPLQHSVSGLSVSDDESGGDESGDDSGEEPAVVASAPIVSPATTPAAAKCPPASTANRGRRLAK
jgi:hypothetical protein